MAPKKGAPAPSKKSAKPAPKKDSKPKKDAPKKSGKPSGKGKDKQGKEGKEGWPKQLFEPRPKNWTIGNDIKPKRDLSRVVKWPAYIRRQRQKRVLLKRLRVPPAVNQFRYTIDKNNKKELFKFAAKYKPEGAVERRKRLKGEATAKLKDPKTKPSLPEPRLYFGVQRVFRLVEQKRAKLVLIAHDVDPIEIILCLPALCKKQGIPFCIVKGKANLGKLVGMKTATCLAFVDIQNSDKGPFDKICAAIKLSYAEKFDAVSHKWGGLRLSRKSRQQASRKKRLARIALKD